MVDPSQRWYEGVRTVVLPSVNTKSLDTITATFSALLDLAVTNRADIVHVHGIGNAVLFPLFRLLGKRVVVGVDGMDWMRAKWNRPQRAYLRFSLYLALKWADQVYVDSLQAQRLCRNRYGRDFPYIGYGTQVRSTTGADALERHDLERDKYILFVGRLIAEKGVHNLIEAYGRVTTDLPLVIVGDNPYQRDYVERLKAAADSRVRFVGTEFGDGFWELCANCHIYVQPSEVEGTSPVLLSAMGCGRCVIVNGIPENVDAIGDAGVAYRRNDVADLARVLTQLLGEPDSVHALGSAARERAMRHYDWDAIADMHEDLFQSLMLREMGDEGEDGTAPE